MTKKNQSTQIPLNYFLVNGRKTTAIDWHSSCRSYSNYNSTNLARRQVQPNIILLLSGAFLTSCAQVQTMTPSVKGNARYEVECSGKLVKMDVCYKKAAALCPRGYRILNQEVRKHNFYPLGSAMGISTSIANAIPGVVKGINIQCN